MRRMDEKRGKTRQRKDDGKEGQTEERSAGRKR